MPITPTDKIWMDGELIDWADAKVHVLTHTMHYGSGVFEGIRAYPTSQRRGGLPAGRPHRRGSLTSAKVFMIDIPFSAEQMIEACRDVVRANNLDDGCYLRPIVYLGYGEMGLNPLPCPVNVADRRPGRGARYLGDEGVANGVRVKVSSWQRHDPNAVPTAAKGTGMYVNSSLAKVEALKAGYDEAILLTPDGQVSECTGENIFIVIDGRLVTPHTSDSGALAGHHPALGRDDRRRPRARGVLRADDPHRPLHGRRGVPDRHGGRGGADRARSTTALVGDGRPGPITKEIQQTYFAAVRGEVDRYKDWLDCRRVRAA